MSTRRNDVTDDRTSGRCFVPYVQDPPLAPDEDSSIS
jgi:hypothetical protein